MGEAKTKDLLLEVTVMSIKVSPAKEDHMHQESHHSRLPWVLCAWTQGLVAPGQLLFPPKNR